MRHLLRIFFVFILGAVNLFATEDSLPEVKVIGNKTQKSLTVLNYETARDRAADIPGGASVVNSEVYKEGRASTLQDALGYQAGVYVQPRFGSEESRISIRGSGIQRTFHLRGIKLLQDGIPINQADGGGDFQALDPLALDYIEVFRGPNALQYGSTTLGGAINFVTPTGYTASPLQARFEVGGFNYLRDQISSGNVMGPVDYYISASELRQDGFRNHSDQWNRRIFSNYGIKLNENAETRFYVGVMDSESKLPGNLTMAQMKQNPKQPNAANFTGNHKRNYDLVQLGNKTSFRWDEESFDLGTFYVHKDLFHPIFQVIDQDSHDGGASFRYQNEANLFDHKNRFTLGFNPVWNYVTAQQHVNVGGKAGALTAHAIQRSYNLDLYAEDQFYVTQKLALVGGAQWSYASRKSTDRFLSDGDHSARPHYVGISPKAGLLFDITERSQIFTNFSRSFEPPSFGELSNVTRGGLQDLRKQMGSTVEIGTRGEEWRLSWDLVYYYSWLENELLGRNDGNGNPLGTINAYGTRHQGIESAVGFSLLEGIFSQKENAEKDRILLRGIYNWSAFRFSNDPVYSNNPLPGIPEHFIRGELVYEHPSGIYFGPTVEMATEYAVDMNHTLFTYPYALFGLKGGYRTEKGFSVFIEAKNLTNEIYAATTGVIADARGLDSAQFLPGDGRSVYSGIEWRW